VLPDTEAGYPNGVAVDADGRYMYIAAWTGQQAIKYDLGARERVETVDLDFMPDNLTWTDRGTLLAAGILGLGGNLAGFEVAEIDPETMNVRTVYRSEGEPSPIAGVSVAIQWNDDVFVGSFQGDRLVRVDWSED
jgi:sugar lactone lactonase YvrE